MDGKWTRTLPQVSHSLGTEEASIGRPVLQSNAVFHRHEALLDHLQPALVAHLPLEGRLVPDECVAARHHQVEMFRHRLAQNTRLSLVKQLYAVPYSFVDAASCLLQNQ